MMYSKRNSKIRNKLAGAVIIASARFRVIVLRQRLEIQSYSV